MPGLDEKVKNFVESCDECQRYKNPGRAYGHLPPRDDSATPFEEIAVDGIGPWTMDVPGVGKLSFSALTTIDIATTLVEIATMDTNPTAKHASYVFETSWLSRYPRPTRCMMKSGSFEVSGHLPQRDFSQNALWRTLMPRGKTPIKIDDMLLIQVPPQEARGT